MRGTKPLPSNVRLLRGTPDSKTMVPDAEQPKPKVKIPEPPDELSEKERAIFTLTATKLAGMRVMTDSDVEALVIYSRNAALAIEAHARSFENPIVKTKAGNPVQNPYFAIARKSEDRCLRLLVEFGMTPSSRTRVRAG